MFAGTAAPLDDDEDEDDFDEDLDSTEIGPGGTSSGGASEADDDGRIYKNPRNSPSVLCPRDEDQATLLGQKCLRKCSSDEDCKSKKKKCLCDGACGMSCIKPGKNKIINYYMYLGITQLRLIAIYLQKKINGSIFTPVCSHFDGS